MKRFKTLLMMAFVVALCSGVANAESTRDLIQQNRFYSLYSLQALPPNLSAYNNVYFVSSISPRKSDAEDGRHGESMWLPFATIDYAIGRCVAPTSANNRMGDVIIVSPNHVEDPATGVTIDVDVAGVTIWGQGFGLNRPRIDMSFADNSFDIGANNCTIRGITLRPSVTVVLIAFEVESGVTGTRFEDCELLVGEAGDGTDEFVKGFHLVSGNHDTVFKNVTGRTHISCNGATHAIHVDAASHRVVYDNVIFDGPWSTGGIVEDAAGLNQVLVDCSFTTTGTDYSFNASSTFAKRIRNLEAGVAEDAIYNFIGRDDSNNVAATTNVAANRDGSILERLEDLLDYLVDDTATNFIGVDDGANLGLTTSVVPDHDGSILERLEAIGAANGPSLNNPNYFTVATGTFDTTGTWSTVAAHEIAVVTGHVRMQIMIEVLVGTETVSADGTIALGCAGNVAFILAATDVEGGAGALITGDIVSAVFGGAITGLAGSEASAAATHAIFDVVIPAGLDVGYTVGTNALDAGSLIFHIWWNPLDSTGAVTAGAGGPF